MAEYTVVRKVPFRYEGIALAVGIDHKSFWDGVVAEVKRRNITKTDLTAVRAVVDAHIALRNLFLGSIPGELRRTPNVTRTNGAVATGLVTRATTLKIKVVAGSALATLLDGAATNSQKVQIPHTDFFVTVGAGALVDANANKEYPLTLTE